MKVSIGTLRPFQAVVALQISSPTFLGERPRGPTLGAREDVAPTSPPTARSFTGQHKSHIYLRHRQCSHTKYSNFTLTL